MLASRRFPIGLMARPLRVEFEGAWYHLMNRGTDRCKVFLAHADYVKFLDLLGEVAQIFNLEIHAYCLMGNHYHLLVCTPDAGLGRAMRHLNGVYTQSFNRRTRRDGPLFRGRYRGVLVDSDVYRLQVSRYIHLNPCEVGVVDLPEAYGHSSYRAYLEPQAAPDWLITSNLLGDFGSRNPRGAYREFVECGIDAETRAFYEAEQLQPVLGGDAFKATIQARVENGNHHRGPEVPDLRRLRSRPSLTAIAAAVAASFGVDPRALHSATCGRNTRLVLARCTAIYLARHEAGVSLGSIAAWLGYRSYNSAATALTRYRRRLQDSEVRAWAERARAILYKVET
jgi:REP element-mobilizing transposase RayT